MEQIHAVGLIGLGLVGSALAERLLAAGFGVRGWDTDAARRNALAARGVAIANSASAASADAHWVVLALPDTVASASVIAEITPVMASGTILIDTGTNDPQCIAARADELLVHQITLLDVPLSGSSERIRAGEAIAIGGGDRAAWDASGAVISAISRHAFHLGSAGCGSCAKLATNLLLGLNRAALAEALVFAEALNLDLPSFLDLVRVTPAYSRAVDIKGNKMIAHDYTPDSRIRQHRKDVALILAAGKRNGSALPLSTTHAALLDAAIAAGEGDLDNAAIIETIRRAGQPVES